VKAAAPRKLAVNLKVNRHVAVARQKSLFAELCAGPPVIFRAADERDRKEVTMPQIRTEQQPVTQITVVEAEPGKQAQALELMGQRAEFMARQPGFVSISLHRSLDGRRIVNYVQWESRDLLAAAHRSPEFRREWAQFDELADDIDPHLYEVARVVGGR
jgi:heme-degrading monooxygenase HmoA